MKSAREKMDMVGAYYDVGSFRGAADICGTTAKTVKRAVLAHQHGSQPPRRAERARNYDVVRDVVAKRVHSTKGRISAKRLLPEARSAVHRLSPQLPPAGGPGQERLAGVAPPGTAPWRVVSGRDAHHRLGERGRAAYLLCRVGLESVPPAPTPSVRGHRSRVAGRPAGRGRAAARQDQAPRSGARAPR